MKGGDYMARELAVLYNMGLKDYEIAYIEYLRQKEINKKHWQK